MRLLIIPAMIAIAGCTTSQAYMRNLEYHGALSVDRSRYSNADFDVKLQNVIDFAYNPDDPKQRAEAAITAVKDSCKNPKIVKDDKISRGKYFGGRPANQYIVSIACS